MEFHREFEAHTDKILRRRLLWFIGIWGGLSVLVSIPSWVMAVDQTFDLGWFDEEVAEALNSRLKISAFAIVQLIWTAVYATALVLTLKNKLSNKQAVWVSVALIAADGIGGIALRASGLGLGTGVWSFAVSHLVAALVFPWTARQAALPAAIVLTVNAVSRLFIEQGEFSNHLLLVALSPLVALPGCLIAWARHSRRVGQYKYTFVQKRYGSLRQELAYARSIHESMFPHPRTGRNVNFTYKYEPMRQIGGDYLFASHCPTDDGDDEALSVVLLDVTGHGIPAALTVNRLHGEIELLFADDPFIAPGEVLRRLNRYVHLTLARHSIYVTAVCLKADPQRNTLTYASGGHPPAFLRAVDGTLADLESTTFVLGACPDTDFDPGERSIPFGPGDSVISYTDGATEARRETGQMLRISGMRKLLATRDRVEPGHWPERLLDAVARHREGLPPEDDTLVVEIYRDLRDTRTKRPEKVSPADRAQSDRGAPPVAHHSPAS
jgi:serine phosphatase RsbU (regulator of sigma subunit)